MNKSFIPYELQHGLLADLSDDEFPTELWGFSCNDEDEPGELELPATGTYFGYVYGGDLEITLNEEYQFTLSKGMYFSVPGGCYLCSGGALAENAILINRLNYNGMFSIGGPIESTGRLRYVSGCTDSLLIPPVMKGDPCLNALYFPPHIDQVPHTHPSMRVGMVVSGEGQCVTPDGVITLVPGMVFVIPANKLHSFRTEDSSMVVIAYHPDSDYGPTHEVHPMIKSTYVNSISASILEDIHTHAS